MTTNDKSKKRKDCIINKTELWNIFDTEIEESNIKCKIKIDRINTLSNL